MAEESAGMIKHLTGVPGWLWGLTSFLGHLVNMILGSGPFLMVNPAYIQQFHDWLQANWPPLASIFTFEALFQIVNWVVMALFIFLILLAIKSVWSEKLSTIATVILTSAFWLALFWLFGLGGLVAVGLSLLYAWLKG